MGADAGRGMLMAAENFRACYGMKFDFEGFVRKSARAFSRARDLATGAARHGREVNSSGLPETATAILPNLCLYYRAAVVAGAARLIAICTLVM
jgi:hypothetical protein